MSVHFDGFYKMSTFELEFKLEVCIQKGINSTFAQKLVYFIFNLHVYGTCKN